MVENREQQKTRYQGVVHVIEGNFYRGFGPPGSGLCVSCYQLMQETMKKIFKILWEYTPDVLFVSGAVIATYYMLGPELIAEIDTVYEGGNMPKLPELPKLPDLPDLPFTAPTEKTIVTGPIAYSVNLITFAVGISALGLDLLLRKLLSRIADIKQNQS